MDPESLDDRLQRQHLSEKALRQFESETWIRVRHLPAPETSQGRLRLIREVLGEEDTPDVLGIDVVWSGLLDDVLAVNASASDRASCSGGALACG
jgi:hypothetical protein